MCAKKKAVPSEMWRMVGEPLRSKPLSEAEQTRLINEFFIYRLRGALHGVFCQI